MLNKIYKKYCSLNNIKKDSIAFSFAIVGGLSSIFSTLGYSLADIECLNIFYRAFIYICAYILFFVISFKSIKGLFKSSIDLDVNSNQVEISCGDIFKTEGYKVIDCDTCFRTQVDDVVISKKSLHGKMVLDHGKKEDIDKLVEETAKSMNIEKKNGLYHFPLGTIISYDSGNETYLMLAMTELNDKYEAHTNMADFENMLMRMWREISRVYASNDIVFPILGSGITRFDNVNKSRNNLLRCMLCTLRNSGLIFNSKIKIVIYGDAKDIPLYEFRDIYKAGLE